MGATIEGRWDPGGEDRLLPGLAHARGQWRPPKAHDNLPRTRRPRGLWRPAACGEPMAGGNAMACRDRSAGGEPRRVATHGRRQHPGLPLWPAACLRSHSAPMACGDPWPAATPGLRVPSGLRRRMAGGGTWPAAISWQPAAKRPAAIPCPATVRPAPTPWPARAPWAVATKCLAAHGLRRPRGLRTPTTWPALAHGLRQPHATWPVDSMTCAYSLACPTTDGDPVARGNPMAHRASWPATILARTAQPPHRARASSTPLAIAAGV